MSFGSICHLLSTVDMMKQTRVHGFTGQLPNTRRLPDLRLPNRLHGQSSKRSSKSTTITSSSSNSSNSSSSYVISKRDWLLSLGAVTLPISPAAASVTLTLKGKTELQPFTLKAGFTVVVPNDWALAYDRSGTNELGTQVFFANLRSFTTLSIFKVPLQIPADKSSLSPEQLLDAVLAEQRDNQSTFGFQLLSGPSPTARVVPAANVEGAAGGVNGSRTYYDSEYVLSICRGLAQEGSGGRRRCVGPNDMDLQIVSRHFFQTLTVEGNFVYVVRGSTTTEQWEAIGPVAIEAVRSFRLP